MSEEKDIFENLFKEGLSDVEIPVTDTLWKRIRVTIKAKRRRRMLLWFSLSGILLVSGLIAVNTFMRTETSNAPHDQKVIALRNESANRNNQEENTKTLVEETVSPSKTANTIKNVQNPNDDQNLKTKQFSVVPIDSISSAEKKIKALPKNDPFINIPQKALLKAKKKCSETGKRESPGKVKTDSLLKDETLKATDPSTTSGKNVLVNESKNVLNDNLIDSLQVKTDSLIIKSDSMNQNVAKADSLNRPLPEKKDSVKTKNVNCFAETEGGLLFNRSFFLGPETADSYKANYNALYSPNAMIQFGLNFKNFNFATGAGISTFPGRYSNSYELSRMDTVYTTYYDSLGNPYYDTTVAEVNSPYSLNSSQKLEFISIPLSVSYSFKPIAKWNIEPGIGVAFNILTKADLSWIDPETNATVFKTKNDLNKYYMSFRPFIKTEYRISSSFGINAGGTWNMFTNMVDAGDILIKPSGIQLNAGLRYYFK